MLHFAPLHKAPAPLSMTGWFCDNMFKNFKVLLRSENRAMADEASYNVRGRRSKFRYTHIDSDIKGIGKFDNWIWG